MEKVYCSYCKKMLLRCLSSIKKSKNFFCNGRCKSKFYTIFLKGKNNPNYGKIKKIKTYCNYCKKKLLKHPCHFKKNKRNFCNIKCRAKFYSGKNNVNWKKKKKVFCSYCKKLILKNPNQIKADKKYFCNKKCYGKFQSKFRIGKNHPHWGGGKIEIFCTFCKKSIFIKSYRLKKSENHFCDAKCLGKWFSIVRKGKKSPLWKKIKIQCTYCKKAIYRTTYKLKINKRHFCNKKCKENWMIITNENKGKNNPNWLNGISFELYGEKFDKNLKSFIRKRDQYKCQNEECGIPEKECNTKLHCHHIDYCKKNSDPINLIALCRKCHITTNHNRKYWQEYYENIQIKRKVHTLEKYVN